MARKVLSGNLLAAHVCRRLPAKPLMVMVGILIIVLSLRTIWQSLF